MITVREIKLHFCMVKWCFSISVFSFDISTTLNEKLSNALFAWIEENQRFVEYVTL